MSICEEDSDFEDLPDFFVEGDGPDGDIDPFQNAADQGKEVRFTAIHNKPLPFSTIRHNCWIPGVPIHIKVIEAVRDNPHIKIFNPNLYTIQVTHGEFQWTLRRRFKHFDSLHKDLLLFRMRYKLVPTKHHKQRRQSVHGKKNRVPRFPKKPEILVRTERDLEKRKSHLEAYLQNLLHIGVYRNHLETLKFLEVSHLSFVKKLGKKWKEGAIMKCSGGRRISIGCCGCLQKFHFAGRWNKRWLLIKDSFIAYIRPRDGIICDVMLMDSQFTVQNGFGNTGAAHGLQISNLNRNLLAKCWTRRKADEWEDAIRNAATSPMGRDYSEVNRFDSFAPVRENSYAKWFIDGSTYFSAVADALENAQEEIFIADWWLSPEIYLKRPITEGNKWRLDQLLERKAKEGVKVFILLYKEMSLALNLQSIYSKHTLSSKCPENIKVLRHPDHGAGGVLLWAHHEKIVAIDQKVAFLGGLDLCYGRWDDGKHRLSDLGCIVYDSKNQTASTVPSINVQTNDDDAINNEETLHLTGITINVCPPSPNVNRKNSMQSNQNSSDAEDVFYDAEEKTEDQTDNVSQNDCVCQQLSKSDSFHSYDNNSLEEEQCNKVTHQNNDRTKEPQLCKIVTALIHNSKSDQTQTGNNNMCASNHTEEGNHASSNNLDNENIFSLSAKEARNSILKNSQKRQSKTEGSRPNSDQNSLKVKWKEEPNQESSEDEKKKKLKKEMPKFSFKSRNSKKKQDVECIGFSALHKEEESTPLKGSSNDVILRRSISMQQGQNPSVNSDDPDKGEKRSNWSKWKLRRSFSNPEENNNRNSHSSSEGPVTEGLAQRRWKMVLNVQKFQSAVRQQQQETIPIPDKKSHNPRLSMKIRNLKDQFKHDGHRDSITDMTDKKGDLLGVATLQRTTSEIAIEELGLKGSSKYWIGKDYVNFIHKDFVDLDDPFADFIDRYKTPRMPWHDIGAVVYGKAARDVSRHFIARWNATKVEKVKANKDYPLLLPKFYGPHNMVPVAVRECTDEVRTQILRSSCGWSAGIKNTECSIQTAYVHCIESAKHFIYIENQFFITHVGDHSVVKNEIGDALFKRIIRAHRNDENFRVIVVMPLLPAFEGNIGGDGAFAIQAVTHFNYTSMCKGPNSLWQKLRKEVMDPLKYITFCGLRGYEELSGKLVSELVYVHSKLMIVDDDTAIIGSANINDRSMLGDRDSEIAVMIQDIHKHPVTFNGIQHKAGKCVSALRKSLFREHLGLQKDDPIVDDITSDDFYKKTLLSQASINTSVFQKVFNCIPSDHVKSFAELSSYTNAKTLAEIDPAKAKDELKKIKGNIVLMPLNFLENESSIIPSHGKESFLPNSVWI